MGTNVSQKGTFRCRLVEKGIGKTKPKTKDERDPGGYPQLITKVVMTQFYDATEKTWFDVTDWDAEITAYLLLYGFIKKAQAVGKTLTCEQIMKVFDWDGASLAELMQTDHTDLEFQVRINDNDPEYADKTPFQVEWIDVYDADPVRTLRKLDAKEIKDLDAQFSNITASAKKAASAKPKAATTPKKSPPKAPAKMTAAEKKAITKKRSDKVKADAAAPKKSPPPPPDDESTDLPLPEATGSLTKSEAWGKIFEMRDPDIDDGTVKELWDAAIEEVTGPDKVPHADITGEQWYQVKEIVLKDCGKF